MQKEYICKNYLKICKIWQKSVKNLHYKTAYYAKNMLKMQNICKSYVEGLTNIQLFQYAEYTNYIIVTNMQNLCPICSLCRPCHQYHQYAKPTCTPVRDSNFKSHNTHTIRVTRVSLSPAGGLLARACHGAVALRPESESV